MQEPLSRWVESILGGEGVKAPCATSPVSNALRQDGDDDGQNEASNTDPSDLEGQEAAATPYRGQEGQEGQEGQAGLGPSPKGAPKEHKRGFPKLEFVEQVLSEQEGVLAAFPEWSQGRPGGNARGADQEGAIVQLRGAKYGSSVWWIARLGSSPFGTSDAYHRKGGGLVVHRLGGAPDERNWNWAPPGAAYGLRVGEIGRFMDPGLCLEIEAYGKQRSTLSELMHMAQLRLHAARVRVAPVVFASVLARFPDPEKVNARREGIEAKPVLVGVLTASQLHTYTFHDLLRAISDTEKTADDLECTRSALVAAGKEVAFLLQRVAAKSGLIVLNAVSDYVVFVPRLEPSEDGEHWAVHGLSLKTSVHDFSEGEAMLLGVDERLWLPVADELALADANAKGVEIASWAFHSGLFLASVAQRHRGAAEAVAEGFLDALSWAKAVCSVAEGSAECFKKKLDGALAKRPLGEDAVGDVLLDALGGATATFLSEFQGFTDPTPSQVVDLARKCYGAWTRHVAQDGPWSN